MVKKSERERASVHVMLYALLVFAFAMDRFRRPSWYSKGIRTDVFCVNKEKNESANSRDKKGKGVYVWDRRALCSSFTSFVFFIYFMCLPYCWRYVSSILLALGYMAFALCSSFTSFVLFIYFMCLPYCFLHLLCLLS